MLLLVVSLVFVFGANAIISADNAFDVTSLEKLLYLKFSDEGYTITGKDGATMNVDVNDQSPWSNGGFHIDEDRGSFFSVNNVDLHRTDGADASFDTGYLFKFTINFGKYGSICQSPCADGGTTCSGKADEYVVEDSAQADAAQAIFSIPVPGQPNNLHFSVRRFDNVLDWADCSNAQPYYQFELVSAGGHAGAWVVRSYHDIWLEDGKDHTFILSVPYTKTFTGSRDEWALLFIDGEYICNGGGYSWTNSNSASKITRCSTLGASPNQACENSRLYLGARPTEWVTAPQSHTASHPFDFITVQFLSGATFKDFQIWSYIGITDPADAQFCYGADSKHVCVMHRNQPECKERTSGDKFLGELDFLGISTAPISPCTAPKSCLTRPSTDANCGFEGNACATGFICCNRVCVDSFELAHCGGCDGCSEDDEVCCNGKCVDTFTDSDNCYACGQACSDPEAECCDDYIGCTGTDVNCNDCEDPTGDDCTAKGANFHCCNFNCVDVSANSDDDCGACGNKCSDLDNEERNLHYMCCGGGCVEVNSNEHCGECGKVCTGGDASACCGGECVQLETDEHCGSCGHNCNEIGAAQGKELHCCDGLCVEWGTSLTSCGCPTTDCDQQYNKLLGTDVYECCAITGFMPACYDTTNGVSPVDGVDFCGSCGDVCNLDESCCDLEGTLTCLKLDTVDHCGACDTSCGEGQDCCHDGVNTCTDLNQHDTCGSCTNECDFDELCCLDPENTNTCHETRAWWSCGDACEALANCEDDHAPGWGCCDVEGAGVCKDLANPVDEDCGCDGNCLLNGQFCCDSECTTYGTLSDCDDCNNDCEGTWAACCIDDPLALDPEAMYECRDLFDDHDNCGKCGRVCGTDEACCSGECKSIKEIERCGDCETACNAVSQFCCAGNGGWECTDFGTLDTACGCPDTEGVFEDCTAIPPPEENHDEVFSCCKGSCEPKWSTDCVD